MSLDTLSLTSEQRNAFEKLQAVTASPGESKSDERIHHELAILESVGWDIERAVNAIYSAPKRKIQPMDIDDSTQNGSTGSLHGRARPTSSIFPVKIFFSLLSLAAYPITLTFGIISHVFRFLRIPLPRAPIGFNLAFLTHSRGMFTGTNASRAPRLPDTPTYAAERLIRDLEEETSAMVISRARAVQAESTPLSGSSHVRDMLFIEPSRKLLPDFHVGSYDSALQLARQEGRPLCVVLLSEEHDDTPTFKKTVLSDLNFVHALHDGEFVVWIGEIRASDAYQASLKLSATTFPFVAFIALQPRLAVSRSTQGASSPAALTVLSRHPSAAMPAPLTPAALVDHITSTIIPRARPLRLQVLAREEERRLREQQDAAYRSAEQADGERIRRKRREEVEAQQRARLEEDARQKAAEEQRLKEQKHQLYKRWLSYKLSLLNSEPVRGLRIAVRLPDGRLGVRRFTETSNVEDLYVWTGSMLHNLDNEVGKTDFDNFVPEFDFSLAAAFPRCRIPFVKDQLLAKIEALKDGANLIVEDFRNPRSTEGSDIDGSDEEVDGSY